MHLEPVIAAPRARGWHRPVRPVALVLVGGGLLLVWVALVAWAIWYVYGHWESRVHLQQQPLLLRLPAGTQALTEIQTPVATRLQASPVVRVPLHQTVQAEVSDQFVATVKLNATVPIDTAVQVSHEVPVSTVLQAKIDLGRFLPTLDVSLPVSLVVPVNLTVPVKTQVPLNTSLVVSGLFKQPVKLPLNDTLVLHPRIDQPIHARVTRQALFALDGEHAPMPVSLVDARLRVPFDLTVVQRAGAGGDAGATTGH